MKTVESLLGKINQEGGNAQIYQDLGKAYIKLKNIDKAHDAFMKSLEFDSQDPWTHLYLGNIFFRKQQYREAIVWFEKSIHLIQDAAVPYWCLAESYEKLGGNNAADFFYRKAVKVEPESEEAQKKLDSWIKKKKEK